ncbi:aminotransferase class I/II-fold pyridoxal phosphate-dependent enzyme [Bradyrhizobium sp. 132]|uniref:trans-sulfuration enzyme family protein n=1 Tax=unclassified Bradyrhizobium TaxID=2631580 RepID=UPI003211DBBB
MGGKLYGREFNPTTALLESRLANLEGAEDAVVLASGMAAFGALVLSLLSQDDELIVHRTLYSNTTTMTEQGLPRFGIKTIPVDLNDPANLDTVLTSRSRAVYFETPVNPTGDVLDIEAIAQRARRAGLLVIVDGTFASPALQRPLQWADIVLHSLTKYISGHGDVLGGALLGRTELIEKIRDRGLRYITGAVMSPMVSSLILRGIKTLPLRMDRHGSNALAIARMLDAHSAVEWVNYPFLPSHPRHAIAKRQMQRALECCPLVYAGVLMPPDVFSTTSSSLRLPSVSEMLKRLSCIPRAWFMPGAPFVLKRACKGESEMT